jgi:hypothetical protein
MESTDRGPASCPPEIWAEFSKAIDKYVANWDAQLREHLQLIDHHEKFEAEWDESKHPRDEGGRFTDGGGDGWIASLKEHPVFGKEEGTFIAHAEALRPLADQVSFKGLKIGSPPPMGMPDSERYKYFEKLNQIASNMEHDPKQVERWTTLLKERDPKQVALALISGRHIVGIDPGDVRLALDQVKDPRDRAGYLGQLATMPNVNGRAPYDRIMLAYAIEHGLSPHEMMEQRAAATAYSSVAYKEMNESLRLGRAPDPSAVPVIAAFDRLLKTAPDVKSGDTLYRGMRLHRIKGSELIEKLRTPGSTFTEKGFVSASSSEGFVNNWVRLKALEDDGDPSRLYFKVEWPHTGGGKNITAFHALGMTEGEVNYRPGSKFVVKSATETKRNHWHVKVGVSP